MGGGSEWALAGACTGDTWRCACRRLEQKPSAECLISTHRNIVLRLPLTTACAARRCLAAVTMRRGLHGRTVVDSGT